MSKVENRSPLVVLLLAAFVFLLDGCSKAAPPSVARSRAPESEGLAEVPAGQGAEPAGRAPEPVGPKPGQGCRQVSLEPPCTLSLLAPSRPGNEPVVSYLVRYRDAGGREVTPYYLEARRDEQPALERFFKEEKNRVVQCQGGWTTAPCNDTPQLAGFPEPPVGKVTPRR